jgi:hypothetical protein
MNIQQAAAALVAATSPSAAPGAIFQLPWGTTTLDPITIDYPSGPFQLHIRGCGEGATTLVFPEGGITLRMSEPGHSVRMSDLTLAAPSPATPAAVTCVQAVPQGIFRQSGFRRIMFQGTDPGLSNYWADAIVVEGLGTVAFSELMVRGSPTGPQGRGVTLRGVPGALEPYGLVYNFSDCSLWELDDGIVYGDMVQGVTVRASNFTNVRTGIWQPSGATGGAQLAIVASQFGCFSNGVLLGGDLSNLQVSSSLFLLTQPNSAGIGLVGAGSQHAVSSSVFAGMGTPMPGTNGVDYAIGKYQIGAIGSCTFVGLETGINLSSATNFRVGNCAFAGCTNDVVPGVGNTVSP